MPISRVGATNGTAAADATTATITRSVAAGNGGILIIAVRGTVAATVGTVSDGTNTWTQAAGIAATSSTTSGDLWYCKNFASTANITVTVTWAAGASATGALTLIEVTGQDTVTFFDVGNSTAAVTTACASGATGNLAGSNEFVTGSVSGSGNNTFSSAAFSPNGTITTETVANSTGTHVCQVAAFDMVGGTGGATESFTVTDSVSAATVTICAAFLPAAGAVGKANKQPPPGPRPRPVQRGVSHGQPGTPTPFGKANRQPPYTPPRRPVTRGQSRGQPGSATPFGTAPRQPPTMGPRPRPLRRAVTGPRTGSAGQPGSPTPPPPGPPPVIPTSGGDRGVTIRVFRSIAPGDVPAAGAQLPRLQGRAFLVPIPDDVEHTTHSWAAAPEPVPPEPGLLDAIAAAGARLEAATGRAVELGRIFADPPYERKPKTCGAIRKIGGTMLACKRKPGHAGKHHDRGLDWQ